MHEWFISEIHHIPKTPSLLNVLFVAEHLMPHSDMPDADRVTLLRRQQELRAQARAVAGLIGVPTQPGC